MLKKLLVSGSLLSILFLAGCSSGKDEVETVQKENETNTQEQVEVTKEVDTIKLSSIVEAYESEGVAVDVNEKPLYEMIGAKDGVVFYVDNMPVKIYEYDSEEEINKNKEAFPMMNEWEQKGLILLETKSNKAVEIFNNIE